MQDQSAFHLLQPLILSLCRAVLERAELLWIERFLFILRQRRWRADAARRKKKLHLFLFTAALLYFHVSADEPRQTQR